MIKRYYHQVLSDFIAFLTPVSEASKYLIVSDELGNVDDAQVFLEKIKADLPADGRVVITQYNALWEPVVRLATRLGWRNGPVEQNWLSLQDLRNFSYLAGFETVKFGTKMLFHYVVLRKSEPRVPQTKVGAPSISIIVPARNEAGTIEKIARELPELGKFTEIIFIEGNSTDNTYEEIVRVAGLLGVGSIGVRSSAGGKKRRISYAKQEGKGKGDAVRKGFEMATGDILAIYDADMTVPAVEMKKFYDAIVSNKGDFINGSRLVYPLEKDSMRVLNFFGNKFFSLSFSWILGQPLKDTLCGTKVLWRADYEKIKRGRAFFGDFDPFGDFDLLFGAAKLNLKIIDMPIHYKQRVYGTTNISRWKHGWLLLRMTVFAAGKLKFA